MVIFTLRNANGAVIVNQIKSKSLNVNASVFVLVEKLIMIMSILIILSSQTYLKEQSKYCTGIKFESSMIQSQKLETIAITNTTKPYFLKEHVFSMATQDFEEMPRKCTTISKERKGFS